MGGPGGGGGGAPGIWYKFPNDFIDGNHSSFFKYWDGGQYVEWTELSGPGCGIWQSGRNGGANQLAVYENGSGANNTFLVNFNDPPPPTGFMLIVR